MRIYLFPLTTINTHRHTYRERDTHRHKTHTHTHTHTHIYIYIIWNLIFVHKQCSISVIEHIYVSFHGVHRESTALGDCQFLINAVFWSGLIAANIWTDEWVSNTQIISVWFYLCIFKQKSFIYTRLIKRLFIYHFWIAYFVNVYINGRCSLRNLPLCHGNEI